MNVTCTWEGHLASLSAIFILGAGPAFADASPDAAKAAAQTLENPSSAEIIVTAQKRAENVQKVPLAVSVLAPAQLQAANVTQFQDLSKVAPSLRINVAQQPLNSNISMRGVGTLALSIGVEPSVAVLVDEVPLATQARAFTDLPDVERIEVLRGPQSTLYGKSASAGLINLITRNPTTTLKAKINALATSDDEYGINGYVSGPMTSNLGFVASASYSRWNGNVHNIILNREVNGREGTNFRGKLKWEPAANASFTLSANYNDGNTHSGTPFVRMDPSALYLGVSGLMANITLPGVTVSASNNKVVDNIDSGTSYGGFGGYLRGDIGVGTMNLVTITSYDRFHQHDLVDQDQTASPVSGNNVEDGRFHSTLVTQEVRLLSPGDKPFRYTVGFYFANADFDRDFVRGPQFSLASWVATSQSRQVAGFLQADWTVVPRLTLTGGARVQNERVGYSFLDRQNGNAFFNGHASDTAGTYRLSARYDITPDINIFGTYATGHKGQTYDLTTGFNSTRAAAGPVRPESSKDWEGGLRSQFFSRRLTANLTYFHVDYTDLQAQSIETVGTTQNFRLTNVGGLLTQGLELDLSTRPIKDVDVGGSATYLDAKYSSYPTAQCYTAQTVAQGCIAATSTVPAHQDLSGSRLGSPMWTFVLNGQFSPALTSSLRGVASVNWQFQSHNYVQDVETAQPDRTIVNISLGIRPEDRRWEITAFVNNLFNTHYYAGLINRANYYNNKQATQALLGRDYNRYAGIRASYNF